MNSELFFIIRVTEFVTQIYNKILYILFSDKKCRIKNMLHANLQSIKTVRRPKEEQLPPAAELELYIIVHKKVQLPSLVPDHQGVKPWILKMVSKHTRFIL